MTKYFMVAMGGALGSVLRFWAGGYIANRFPSRFPTGTFIINCTASFLIGFVITVFSEKTSWSPHWRYLIAIGFIGGFSTFSTFEYESFRAFQEGDVLISGLNVVFSVIVGFVSVWLGVIAGRTIA